MTVDFDSTMREKIIEILANTANGTIHEMGYESRLKDKDVKIRQLEEQNNLLGRQIGEAQGVNEKLYHDNVNLINMRKDLEIKIQTMTSIHYSDREFVSADEGSKLNRIADLEVEKHRLASQNASLANELREARQLIQDKLHLVYRSPTSVHQDNSHPINPPQNGFLNGQHLSQSPISRQSPNQPNVGTVHQRNAPQPLQQIPYSTSPSTTGRPSSNVAVGPISHPNALMQQIAHASQTHHQTFVSPQPHVQQTQLRTNSAPQNFINTLPNQRRGSHGQSSRQPGAMQHVSAHSRRVSQPHPQHSHLAADSSTSRSNSMPQIRQNSLTGAFNMQGTPVQPQRQVQNNPAESRTIRARTSSTDGNPPQAKTQLFRNGMDVVASWNRSSSMNSAISAAQALESGHSAQTLRRIGFNSGSLTLSPTASAFEQPCKDVDPSSDLSGHVSESTPLPKPLQLPPSPPKSARNSLSNSSGLSNRQSITSSVQSAISPVGQSNGMLFHDVQMQDLVDSLIVSANVPPIPELQNSSPPSSGYVLSPSTNSPVLKRSISDSPDSPSEKRPRLGNEMAVDDQGSSTIPEQAPETVPAGDQPSGDIITDSATDQNGVGHSALVGHSNGGEEDNAARTDVCLDIIELVDGSTNERLCILCNDRFLMGETNEPPPRFVDATLQDLESHLTSCHAEAWKMALNPSEDSEV